MNNQILFVLSLIAIEECQAPLRAQPPTITNQPVSRTVWAGASVTFATGVSGGEPFTYQWQFDKTNLPGYIMATVAGGGVAGAHGGLGDGGPATQAVLSNCTGVVVGPSGDLFIADTGNNRIRKVSTAGIITTVAGNGKAGFLGDGGSAQKAELSGPTGVATDAGGNLFIADNGNSRARKVDTNGIITTVAGGGPWYYFPPTNGNLATNVWLQGASSVLIDGNGNLFVADWLIDGRVFMVSTDGIITTVAGGGTNFNSYGDGGPATNAIIGSPQGLALDSTGNLFIADSSSGRIRKVSTDGIITTVSYSTDFTFPYQPYIRFAPSGLAMDAAGNLFIVDPGDGLVSDLTCFGDMMTIVAWLPPSAITVSDQFNPQGVALDASGNLFIAVGKPPDLVGNQIWKVSTTQAPALALNNVQPTNSGNYQVVVSGPGGQVKSGTATLTVVTSPLIYQAVLSPDDSVTLDSVSRPGSTNVLFWTDSLSPPVSWQPLSTNVAGPDGDWQYADTGTASHPTRFYSFQEE